jgi:hypothetical protein
MVLCAVISLLYLHAMYVSFCWFVLVLSVVSYCLCRRIFSTLQGQTLILKFGVVNNTTSLSCIFEACGISLTCETMEVHLPTIF